MNGILLFFERNHNILSILALKYFYGLFLKILDLYNFKQLNFYEDRKKV